jgi:hypothetical protein
MSKAPSALMALAFALIFQGAECAAQANAAPPAAGAYVKLGEIKSASYLVRLSSNPNPPIRGFDWLEAVVVDASGKAIDDAQVRFMMPGPWRVIVHIAGNSRSTEDLRFEFNVNFR